MKLNKQCCTLKQAITLKEKGIQQVSTFYFYEEIVNAKRRFVLKPLEVISWTSGSEKNEDVVNALSGKDKNEVYAAFTLSELGAMLPIKVCSVRTNTYDIQISKSDFNLDIPLDLLVIKSDFSEAEARAAMLIYGIENNLNGFSIVDINQRLRLV